MRPGRARREGSALVPELLRKYGAWTRARLLRYLPAKSRHPLDSLIVEYPRRGGKMLRPTLLIATARAFGASMEETMGAAVALELLHNVQLIHDDIEDFSEHRRGKPALHQEHGIPLALCAGDALACRSLRPLIDSEAVLGPELTLQVFEETLRMSRESAEGQALELGWCRDNVMTLDASDYFHMVLKKTCWLAFIFPGRAGALIGSRGTADLEPFIRFGFLLGATFQIKDDLLNLTGNLEDYGKEINGDLYEGKRTLMLIRLMQEADLRERERLREILGRPRSERTAGDVRWMRNKIDTYGCIDYAESIAGQLAAGALREQERICRHLPESRDKRFLQEIVPWILERGR